MQTDVGPKYSAYRPNPGRLVYYVSSGERRERKPAGAGRGPGRSDADAGEELSRRGGPRAASDGQHEETRSAAPEQRAGRADWRTGRPSSGLAEHPSDYKARRSQHREALTRLRVRRRNARGWRVERGGSRARTAGFSGGP